MEHYEEFEVLARHDGASVIPISLACATVERHYTQTTGNNERQSESCSTGLRVYEGAQALAAFLIQYGAVLVGDCAEPSFAPCVIEIGCGCGLAGFTTAMTLKELNIRVVFTDASEECLYLVKCSAESLKMGCEALTEYSSSIATTYPLTWNSGESAFLSLLHRQEKRAIHLVIGSDIMYYRVDVMDLLSAIRTLLSDAAECSSDPKLAVLCHFMRLADGRRALSECAERIGLRIAQVQLDAFLMPSVVRERGWGGMEVVILFLRRGDSKESHAAVLKGILKDRCEAFAAAGMHKEAKSSQSLSEHILPYTCESEDQNDWDFDHLCDDNGI